MRPSWKTSHIAIGLIATSLFFCAAASAQSGRSVMKGYVSFENVAYVEKQPQAKVELCSDAKRKTCAVAVGTDEHGLYEINPAPLGEWWLRISAPGFITYQISTYLPSDFIGNLAVRLKRASNKKITSRRTVRHQHLGTAQL
jgi:hypothetical protein